MAFASTSQLATRLGRTFTAAETSQAGALLDDATAYLQSEIGQLVEDGTMVVGLTVDPRETRVRLPQWPVQLVNSVLLNGDAITDYEIVDGHLERVVGFPADVGESFSTVTVDYDYGLTVVPSELVTWCCVLAAGAMAQVARGGTLGAAGVTSERVDDYAVNYDADSTAFQLPERILNRLRSSYGAGVHVSGAR